MAERGGDLGTGSARSGTEDKDQTSLSFLGLVLSCAGNRDEQ